MLVPSTSSLGKQSDGDNLKHFLLLLSVPPRHPSSSPCCSNGISIISWGVWQGSPSRKEEGKEQYLRICILVALPGVPASSRRPSTCCLVFSGPGLYVASYFADTPPRAKRGREISAFEYHFYCDKSGVWGEPPRKQERWPGDEVTP